MALLRRPAAALLLALGAVTLAYVLAATALDPRAAFEGLTPRPPEAVVEARLNELDLNPRTPLPVRFGRWAAGAARGDLGRTIDGEPVRAELHRRVLVSLRLLVPGALLGCVLGTATGYAAALRRGRAAGRLLGAGSFVLLATPVFVLAVVLQILAQRANALTGLRLFEWVGEYPPGDPGLLARARHLVLPTLTVALTQAAVYGRYQRGLLLGELGAGYVRAARARGLPYARAVRRHALPCTAAPLATYAAYDVGLVLLGGAFTEKIFGWHGMGEWLVDSIGRGDVNAVAAYALFAVGVFMVAPAARGSWRLCRLVLPRRIGADAPHLLSPDQAAP